jgi:hypothetical protein
LEYVEHSTAVRACSGSVLNLTWDLVRVVGSEMVRDACDCQRQLALEDESELLVRVAVRGDGRVRLELEQVEHRAVPKEGLHPYPGRELAAAVACEGKQLHGRLLL